MTDGQNREKAKAWLWGRRKETTVEVPIDGCVCCDYVQSYVKTEVGSVAFIEFINEDERTEIRRVECVMAFGDLRAYVCGAVTESQVIAELEKQNAKS